MIVAVMIAIAFTGISHSNCSILTSWYYFLKGSSSRAPFVIRGLSSSPAVCTRKQKVILSHRQLVPYQSLPTFLPKHSRSCPLLATCTASPTSSILHPSCLLTGLFKGRSHLVTPLTSLELSMVFTAKCTVQLLSTSLHSSSSWSPFCPWRPLPPPPPQHSHFLTELQVSG